ncbi:MAG: hypothetical protein AAGC77_11830 [Pseudomonadota bacterium]
MKRLGILAMAACFASGAALAEEDVEDLGSLSSQLEGYARTGETETCISTARINTITPLDEETFLVRVGVRNYYLNDLKGSCNGADRSWNRIQYSTSTAQLCRNEIIKIVDNSSGFTVGSCGLGTFERLEQIEDAEEAEDADA